MTRRCPCGLPALPSLSTCLGCAHAELASRGRRAERQRRRKFYVSLAADTYERLTKEAERRGQSARSLLAEVLSEV